MLCGRFFARSESNPARGDLRSMVSARDSELMKSAITRGSRLVQQGRPPFFAYVFQDSRVVAAEGNSSSITSDPTAHAEIEAIRAAAHVLGRSALRGAWMYTVCEPCPMCLSSLYKVGFTRLVYGCRMSDLTEDEYDGIRIPCEEFLEYGTRSVEVVGGVLRREALHLLGEWRRKRVT